MGNGRGNIVLETMENGSDSNNPGTRLVNSRVLEAEAEAIVFVSRFQIGGCDSY